MRCGVFYRPENGTIVGPLAVTPDFIFDENGRPGLGLAELPPDHDALMHPGRWRVEAEVVIPKTQVALAVTGSPFAADGVATCTITAAGLVGDCAVVVNGLAPSLTLTLADPTLVLTSDTPQRFTVEIQDSLHWGDPITVEAV